MDFVSKQIWRSSQGEADGHFMDSDSRIRICFVIDAIESPTAGTEKQLLLLINKLDRTCFKPYLCVLRSSNWVENELADCCLYKIGFTSFGRISAWWAIFRFSAFLRAEGVNIVQAHFRDGSIVGILAARLAGVKARVGTRRNQGYWVNSFELVVQKILNRFTTLFVANCENTKSWAGKTEGIVPQRIVVIPNGLEVANFQNSSAMQRQAFRRQFGFNDNAVLVGIVANLRPVKEVDVFIEAARKVVGKNPQARFVVIGDGPEKNMLEALCRNLGLQSSIHFLGKRLDVPDILSCLDIGVLSSGSESFSNAILEYMAAGLAVVCTDVGGAREAVDDGLNGFVVEPGDYCAMAERISLIIEKDLFADMGRRGREKAVSLYSHEGIVVRYQQLYKEIA